jgi:hypothetical protein
MSFGTAHWISSAGKVSTSTEGLATSSPSTSSQISQAYLEVKMAIKAKDSLVLTMQRNNPKESKRINKYW